MIDVADGKKNDDINELRRFLEEAVRDFRIDSLAEKQLDQLVTHYSMLRRWNQRTNLTRIIDPKQAARLHYAESLFGAQFVKGSGEIADLGSGAGFPAVPLAIMCSQSHIIAIEANHKKALFLKEVKDELGLKNFSVAHSRFEDFDLSGYDLLTSRAIERAGDVIPQVIESLTADQRLMIYCATDLFEELKQRFVEEFAIEVRPIPFSGARIIALFSPACCRVTNNT